MEPSGRRLNQSGCLQPRVIRRALDREVEGDLHAVLMTSLDQALEIGERSKLRVNRIMAALRRADRVRTAWIAGLSPEPIIAALSIGSSDRVNGRQVDDIKSKPGNIWKPSDAVAECPVPTWYVTLAARNHSVPRRSSCARAVDHQRKYL